MFHVPFPSLGSPLIPESTVIPCPTTSQQEYLRNIPVSLLADGTSFGSNTNSYHSSQWRPALLLGIASPCTLYLYQTLQVIHTQTVCMGDGWVGQTGLSFFLFRDRWTEICSDIHGRRETICATGDSAHLLMAIARWSLSNSHSPQEGCSPGSCWVSKCTFSPLVPVGTATEFVWRVTWRMTKYHCMLHCARQAGSYKHFGLVGLPHAWYWLWTQSKEMLLLWRKQQLQVN